MILVVTLGSSEFAAVFGFATVDVTAAFYAPAALAVVIAIANAVTTAVANGIVAVGVAAAVSVGAVAFALVAALVQWLTV